MIKVTVDTNVLDAEALNRIEAAATLKHVEVEIHTVTVNERERGEPVQQRKIAEPMVWGESRWGEGAWGESRTVSELFVLSETPLGSGVLAGSADVTRFEAILRIISNGSFPGAGRREKLTGPQQRQLRDAMTLEAHAREGRDVFITGDLRGFVKHGRREALEALCETRIVTPSEIGVSWP